MNINDYSISEGDKANTERSFIYNMKNYRVKDPIANEVRFVNNKNVIGVGKWSPFYENYSRLRDRGFYRQGGFFSEYVNMHRKEFNEMVLTKEEFLSAYEEHTKSMKKYGIWLFQKMFNIDAIIPCLVTEMWCDGVIIGSARARTIWKYILESFVFEDGTPCGKEIK